MADDVNCVDGMDFIKKVQCSSLSHFFGIIGFRVVGVFFWLNTRDIDY